MAGQIAIGATPSEDDSQNRCEQTLTRVRMACLRSTRGLDQDLIKVNGIGAQPTLDEGGMFGARLGRGKAAESQVPRKISAASLSRWRGRPRARLI